MKQPTIPSPPVDPIHKKLWAMGFTADEREQIIKAASRFYWADAVQLGQAILHFQAHPLNPLTQHAESDILDVQERSRED